MKPSFRKTKKNHNSSELTSHHIKNLLPDVLKKIEHNFLLHTDQILDAWPEIIGEEFAPMTQAISFNSGVLIVKVANSTLYSLLAQNEKFNILARLKKKFPKISIQNIVFRMH